jgi:hypothetical protein
MNLTIWSKMASLTVHWLVAEHTLHVRDVTAEDKLVGVAAVQRRDVGLVERMGITHGHVRSLKVTR